MQNWWKSLNIQNAPSPTTELFKQKTLRGCPARATISALNIHTYSPHILSLLCFLSPFVSFTRPTLQPFPLCWDCEPETQTADLSAYSATAGTEPRCLTPFSSTCVISQHPLPLFPFPLAHGVSWTAGGSPKGTVTRSPWGLFFSFFDLHHLVSDCFSTHHAWSGLTEVLRLLE